MNRPDRRVPSQQTVDGFRIISRSGPKASTGKRVASSRPLPSQNSTPSSTSSLFHHLARMLQTAGHSWVTTEHDILLRPLYRMVPARWHLALRRPASRRSVRRWQTSYFLLLFLALAAIPTTLMIRSSLQAQRYVLSAATKQLVGVPVVALDRQLHYDTKSASFQYNPSAAKGIQAGTNGSSLTIGGSRYYGIDLAKVAAKGQTYTDAQTKLSFSLLPQFGALDGKHIDGHVVYPTDHGQMIYSLKGNGLKEDVVLTQPIDHVSLSYQLQLPNTLQAKLQTDGSVGIYSADPSLFGNISYGDSKDQAAVEKARTSGQKTHLVFLMPAPVITETGKTTSSGVAKFSLNGNELTVSASNLANLTYPISIDPSVVVSSANSFAQGNNEDNNIAFGNSSISRGALTGGALNAGWASAGGSSSLPASQYNVQAIVTNNFIYIYGIETGAIYYNSLSNISGGTITTGWTTATTGIAFATSSTNYTQTVIGYNGYLYEFGGDTGNASTETPAQAEYYAAICTGNNTTTAFTGTNCGSGSPVGSLSSWKSLEASSPWGPRSTVGATAYNGYVYILGGCTARNSVAGGNCKQVATDTWSAPVKADGTLGTWTQVSTAGDVNMTNLRFGYNLQSYNGYLYAAGGCLINTNLNLDNCDNFSTDVSHASIGSGGTIGTWVADSQMQAGRQGAMAVYNGYMYAIGGCTQQNCSNGPGNDIEYAPIYANGSLGTWRVTSSATSAGTPTRFRQAAFAYNGYVFQVSGCIVASGSQCSGGAGSADTISAQINPTGPVGVYQTSTVLNSSSGKMQGATVAYGGYLYVLGGATNNSGGSGWTNAVYYAPINNDGSIGTWASTSAFTTARVGLAAVAYNGYMYIIGGRSATVTSSCTNSSGTIYCNDVQVAAIGSNGTLGSWSLAGSYAAAPGRAEMGAATYDGYLYVFGGDYSNNTSVSNETDAGQIQSNGTVTGWTTTGNLVQSASEFGTAQAGPYLYVLGGRASSGYNQNYTQYAVLNSSGTVTWVSANNTFANGRIYPSASASNGFVYITGGVFFNGGGNAYGDTQYARICLDTTLTDGCNGTVGTLGTWHATSSLATATASPMSAIYNGYLYVMGGCASVGALSACNASPLTTVQYTPLNNGGGGNVASWNPTTLNVFTPARFSQGTVAYNGYLYVIGGCTSASLACSAVTANVQYAPINADGTLGTWVSAGAGASLNLARYAMGATAYNGYMYVLGGCAAGVCSSLTQSCEYAQINSNGTLNAWTVISSCLPGGVGAWLNSATAYNGYMYLVGGSDGTNGINTVQSAAISGTGALGSFSSAGSGGTFPAGSDYNVNGAIGINTFASNGYLYVLGGSNVNNTVNYNDVMSAQIGSGGSLAAWAATTSFPVAARGTSTAINNGYVYVSGGYNGAYLPLVQYAPLLSNGAVGNWTIGLSSPTTRYGGGTVIVNGYMYEVGGYNGSAPSNSTDYAALQVIPRVAHYSRLIDLASTINGNAGGDAEITRYNLVGTLTGATTNLDAAGLCASPATSSGLTFGAASCTSSPPAGVPFPNKSYGRYAFVFITLDDSQAATFPDNNPSTINELDIYFHPAPARRLRGGQTFTNMTSGTPIVNQLDTEGAP